MPSYEKIIKPYLIDVEKPARYTGGEYNTPDISINAAARVCMCFPDLYEVGMSNLGIRILYHMLNDMDGISAERCFAPKQDYADLLTKLNIPLVSLETQSDLKDFDILGFSVQFEMLYTTVLYMLDLANIPFLALDRGEDYPIIIGGGPCSANPEPFAEFFDIIVIGEGEKPMQELSQLMAKCKANKKTKKEFLNEATGIVGVYVPSLNPVIDNGRFVCVEQDKVVEQAFTSDFDKSYFPIKMLIPNIEVIHDRPVIELFRGCPNGCRFCQACFFYRPIRLKTKETLLSQAEAIIKDTGFGEISLASLSSSDYPELENLVTNLSDICTKKHVNLALPSLRMDSFTSEMSASSRMSSLTFAPEAGSERLRNVINKNISDADIEKTVRIAFERGYTSIKLYFMMGLPTETEEDLNGIRQMIWRIKDIYREVPRKRALNITVSVAIFVPKPLTPFQWVAQIDSETIKQKQDFLCKALRIKGVRFNWHGEETSILEAVFARGDRRLAKVIIAAYNNGAKFDSWTEHFNNDIWIKAFEDTGVNMYNYLDEIDTNIRLPWDFIDFYVRKDYLLNEYTISKEGIPTKSCKDSCNACNSDAMRCEK